MIQENFAVDYSSVYKIRMVDMASLGFYKLVYPSMTRFPTTTYFYEHFTLVSTIR